MEDERLDWRWKTLGIGLLIALFLVMNCFSVFPLVEITRENQDLIRRLFQAWRDLPAGWVVFWAFLTAGPILLCGCHAFLRSVYRSWTGETEVWRFRWTATLLALVMTFFASGIAAVGATHQVIWLIRSL